MNFISLTETLSSTSISVMGYNYNVLTNVFLSSNELTFPFLTAIDLYTNLRRVSAICPPFSGYPFTNFNVLDNNRVNLTIDSSLFTGISGLIDIIFANRAGYTKLSDKNHLVQYLSSGVVDFKIITINDEDILTIDNSYLVYIH